MLKETLNKLVSNRNTELAVCKEELEKLSARIAELEKINETSEDENELKAAGEEIDGLKAKKAELEAEIQGKQAELDEINAQLAELDKPAEEEMPQRKKLNFMTKEMRGENKMNKEERAKKAEEFVKTRTTKMESEEVRSVLISSGKLAQPTEVSGINENGFVGVSSILDLVTVVNCEGMGTNRIAYEVSDPTAALHTEGGVIAESDPTYDFVDITPKTYAVLTSISKEAKKQTPLNYTENVRAKALKALRKVAAQVVTTAAANSDLTTAQTITALDAKSLRTIAFNYGGDIGIEGEAWLFLNKLDLVKLGDARGTNEKKPVYEITPDASNPNTGVIKDGGLTVKYCLNNNLAEGTLLYGDPKAIELDLFSNYEIEVSSDFHFNKLMEAIRGDVQLGSAVVVKDGIVKVTVSA